MNDMSRTIIPKSDQLNADDLLTGPITIKVTDVTIRGGQEQPVSIHYEGDNGKPYKACKSMCRVMVAAWGADASKYVGRSMTLYCDPKVKWAGMEVGGIRISHMSDIDSTMTMALTVTRANKKPFTVKPLKITNSPPAQPAPSASPSPPQPDGAQVGEPSTAAPDATIPLDSGLQSTDAQESATQRDYRAEIKEALGFASKSLTARFEMRLKGRKVDDLSDSAAKTALDFLTAEMDKETT
jgi:hypothetical protein